MGPQRYDFPIHFAKSDIRPVTLNGGGGEQGDLLGGSCSPPGEVADPFPCFGVPSVGSPVLGNTENRKGATTAFSLLLH